MMVRITPDVRPRTSTPPRPRRRPSLLWWAGAASIATVLVVAGCANEADPGRASDDAPETTEVPDPPADTLSADFDRDAARRDAEALLGLEEGSFDVAPMRRVVRRGEEHFAVTMDLRPGRQNVELDDDGSGVYVVSRVVIETMDGEPLVVE